MSSRLAQTTDSSIVVDVSNAPWMEIAIAEEKKGIAEKLPLADVKGSLARSLQSQTPKGFHLLDWDKIDQDMVDQYGRLIGPSAKAMTRANNPEINKYFEGVTTDPLRDPKGRGRTWSLDPAAETKQGFEVTAWCAAFVNWCLGQVDAPRIGYATADSWLRYGIPLAHPEYGCVTVVKPSSSTGSTTGHVAFLFEVKGDRVVLLGGNQSNRVKKSDFKKGSVLGYRWPSALAPGALKGTAVV